MALWAQHLLVPVRRRPLLGGRVVLALGLQSATAYSQSAIEIEARGARLRHAQDPTAASTVISGEELRQPGLSSADVLARVPGVQVNRTGAQSDLATASVRGADAAQIPVYLAGIRLNDDISGTADLSTVPLFMIERVEVFRGNAPLAADRLGLGGAIFFWPRLPTRTGLGLGAELGSFGEYGEWLSVETGNRRAGSLLAVKRSGADNDYPYVDDRGQRFDLDEREVTRDNADFEQYDTWAVSRYRFDQGVRLTSVISALRRQQGVTGLALVPAEQARGRSERLLVGNSLSIPCNRERSCEVELTSSLLTADVALVDPALELNALRTSALQNQGNRLTHGIGLRHELGRRWLLNARGSLAFETLHLDRAGSVARRARRSSVVPTLGLEWHATRAWLLHGLGSLECHGTDSTLDPLASRPTDADVLWENAEPAARLGARYRVNSGIELLGNLSRYVRVPTLSELYGSSAVAQGNPSLDSETGLGADLGARAQFHSKDAKQLAVSLDAFAYARTVNNLIRFRRTSTETLAPFNVAEARLLGLELALAADALGHLRIEATAALLDPRETTKDPSLNPTYNDILPLSSRLTTTGYAELYATPEFARLNRTALGLRYSHRSARYADLAGQNVLEPQHFVDLEASAGFSGDLLLARASVQNLLDREASDLIGLPAPGRSYHAALEVWF